MFDTCRVCKGPAAAFQTVVVRREGGARIYFFCERHPQARCIKCGTRKGEFYGPVNICGSCYSKILAHTARFVPAPKAKPTHSARDRQA